MKIKNIIRCMCAILLIATLTGCEASGTALGSVNIKPQKNSKTIFAMDTVMDVTIYGNEEVLDGVEKLITTLESKFSVTSEASDVYKINHSPDEKVQISRYTAELLEQGLSFCKETRGALDISIYPVMTAWGFTTDSFRVPGEDELKELLQYVNYANVILEIGSNTEGNVVYYAGVPQNMSVDLGGIAKGYTGDMIKEYLFEHGVTSALLNLGGNVQAVGSKPDGSAWRIAITDPQNQQDYMGSLSVTDKVVITSGGYQRNFTEDGKTYHHIVNPSTGMPAESGLISVTIIGESGTMCDAYSTALFVMGLDSASSFWKDSRDFEAVFVDESGNIYITEGLEGNFETLNGAKTQVIRR